jgi:hypothetical protein
LEISGLLHLAAESDLLARAPFLSHKLIRYFYRYPSEAGSYTLWIVCMRNLNIQSSEDA